MRKDFGRLVIERERRGSSAKNLKMRKTGRFRLESPDWEEWDYDGPLRIRTQGLGGVKHAYDRQMGEKSFTDVLTPIRGYLHKSIGRPWDDVFSELTAALGRGTWPIRHVLTSHAVGEVSTDTYCENGKIYSQPKQYDYGDYFVDPRDGTLRKEATRPRYRYAAPRLTAITGRMEYGLSESMVSGIWVLMRRTARWRPSARLWLAERRDAGAMWYFVKGRLGRKGTETGASRHTVFR